MWSQKLITAVSEVKPSFLDINDRFVSALDRHGQVHVFDAASCERLHTCDTGSPEPATAVAVRPPHLLIGIEAKVELRTLQDDLPDGPLTRWHRFGRFHRQKLDDGDCYVGEVALKGHSGPLLSVALDPEGEFFATSACDGTARIWQAASGKQIKSWPVAKACSDPALAASPCPLVWEPMAGRLLAMPFDCELRLLASAWSIAWSDAPLREASLRQAAPYFALRSPGLCPVNQLCWWWRSPQAGAAPGSTSGCPRYLVWNRLGCVLEAASAMPDQPRILSVEFHDSALHHGLLIPNAHGFTLAALSLRLLALAAPSTAEALSFVRVRPLSGNDGGEYGGGAEWTQALPRGEDAVCLAASDNRLFAGSDSALMLQSAFVLFKSALNASKCIRTF
uniref:WD_REPEATS_REGION domain-containing protein n=1 Tax=Macrostomum lignano TaxID=282301 RepID=A0A1I8HG86_9PLAT